MTRGAAALAALVGSAGLLRAQEASVFLGASHARYADSLSGTAGFAAVRLASESRLRAVKLEASYSRLTQGGWAAQVGGQATALWPLTGHGPLWAGLAAGAVWSDYQGGLASGTAAAGPLAVWRAASSYLSLGVSGGAVRRIDSTRQWLASGTLRWQWAPGGPVGVDLGVSATAADTQRFADLSAALRLASPAARALLVMGVRAGDLSDNPWGSVEVGWSPGGAVRVEASAGRYPRDLTGFAQGFYAQAGIRVYARGTGRDGPARRRPPGLVVEPAADGSVCLRVRLARAVAEAAIAGDWNAWDPVPLRQEGEVWAVHLRLDPGVYRYAILVDGVWTLPQGIAGMDDEFGAKVGVLVVSARR